MLYKLNEWAFLDVLDRLGRLSVLVAVVLYAAQYQAQQVHEAWQSIYQGTGQGGGGGRGAAVETLIAAGESLAQVNLSKAWMPGIKIATTRRWWTLPPFSTRRANLWGADLSWSMLRRADLRGAYLHEVNLTGAYLDDADFRNTELSLAVLAHTKLGRTRFDSANLIGADLRNTNLRRATGLTASQIQTACTDETTKLPDALNGIRGEHCERPLVFPGAGEPL